MICTSKPVGIAMPGQKYGEVGEVMGPGETGDSCCARMAGHREIGRCCDGPDGMTRCCGVMAMEGMNVFEENAGTL